MTDNEKNELLDLFTEFFYGVTPHEFYEITGESGARCARLCELMSLYNNAPVDELIQKH